MNQNGRRLTNRELAETDQLFRRACEIAGLQPSRTRYRRYKHGYGRPYEIAQGLLRTEAQLDKDATARIAK